MIPQRKLVVAVEVLFLLGLIYLEYYNGITRIFIHSSDVINSIFRFSFFLVLIDFLRRIVTFSYRKRKKLSPYHVDNFQFGINNIAKLLIGFGLIVTIFAMFGIDFMSLLTSLSIVAAAIAITTKEYIDDFLVGLYFSFSSDFEINDYVKIEDHKGKIVEIGMLKIKLLNDDEDIVIIPNSKLYSNEIINYTKKDIRSMSIDFQIDINHVRNIETLESELKTALAEMNDYIEPHSYNLKIKEMKKDALDLKFQYTIKKIDMDKLKKIRSMTVRQVFNHISEKGAT